MDDLHIEVVGSGAPLVLIHGWALHGGVFAPLTERLSAQFQLHLVDLPGHGYSHDSPLPLELNPVIDAICARTPAAAWIGWSLGGLFALKAAALHADNVRGLAMLASSPRIVQSPDWPLAARDEILRQLAHDLQNDYAATIERFFALDAMGSDAARAELQKIRPTLFARGEPAPWIVPEGLRLLERTDLRNQVSALAQKSLWLGGTRDRLVPAAAMQAAAALNARAEFVAIGHAGHAAFVSRADEVATRIAAFAQSL